MPNCLSSSMCGSTLLWLTLCIGKEGRVPGCGSSRKRGIYSQCIGVALCVSVCMSLGMVYDCVSVCSVYAQVYLCVWVRACAHLCMCVSGCVHLAVCICVCNVAHKAWRQCVEVQMKTWSNIQLQAWGSHYQ